VQGLNNLAVIYTAQGKAQEALQTLQAATLADPGYAEVRVGTVIAFLRAHVAVRLQLRTMLNRMNTLTKCALSQAYNNLGVLQRDVGAMADALAAYDKCLELTPDSRNAGAHEMPCGRRALILWLVVFGCRNFAPYAFNKVQEGRSPKNLPSLRAAGQNKLLALNYIYPGEDPKVCVAHAAWGEAFEAGHTPMPARVSPVIVLVVTQVHTSVTTRQPSIDSVTKRL